MKDQIIENPTIKQTFTAILDKAGLTDEFLADRIQTLCNFSKMQVVKGGKDNPDSVVEVEDGQVQLGAVKLGVQLKGHLVERQAVEVTSIEDVLRALDARSKS